MQKQTLVKPEAKEQNIFLFVLWEAARHKQPDVLADIHKRFTVLKQYDLSWPQDNWPEHFVAFYGYESHIWPEKTRRNGTGLFRLVIVNDDHATYGYVTNKKSRILVNTNILKAKNYYRSVIAVKDGIHSSISLAETRSNLAILLGMSLDDFLATVPRDGKVETLITAPPREKGWPNLRNLFYILGETVPYVLLQADEALGESAGSDPAGPIDLIVADKKHFVAVTGAVKLSSNPYDTEYVLDVGGRAVRLDVHEPGDGYLDPSLARGLIDRGVQTTDGIRVPVPEERFYALLYHALIHSSEITPSYQTCFSCAAPSAGIADFAKRFAEQGNTYLKKLLSAWLTQKGYAYYRPLNSKVVFNTANLADSPKVITLKLPRTDLLAWELGLRQLRLHVLSGVNLPNIARVQLRLGSLFKLDFCLGDVRETGI